jgi:hypothetical protein
MALAILLPEALSGTSGLCRLTVALTWLSPVAPNRERYRKAQLWFSTDREDKIGIGREDDGYDHRIVRRGTVQHEIFEGSAAPAPSRTAASCGFKSTAERMPPDWTTQSATGWWSAWR